MNKKPYNLLTQKNNRSSEVDDSNEPKPLEKWQDFVASKLDELVESEIEFTSEKFENKKLIQNKNSNSSFSGDDNTLLIREYPYTDEDTGIRLFKNSDLKTFSETNSETEKLDLLDKSKPLHEEVDPEVEKEEEEKLKSMIDTTGVIVEFTGSSFKHVT